MCVSFFPLEILFVSDVCKAISGNYDDSARICFLSIFSFTVMQMWQINFQNFRHFLSW